MGRQRTIIQTFSDAITGKTTSMLKILIASAALTVGLTGPQIPQAEVPETKPEIQPLPVIDYSDPSWKCLVVVTTKNMSLNNSKNTPRFQIVMLLRRSWVTLNRRASLFPTYARRGLSSLQPLL